MDLAVLDVELGVAGDERRRARSGYTRGYGIELRALLTLGANDDDDDERDDAARPLNPLPLHPSIVSGDRGTRDSARSRRRQCAAVDDADEHAEH